MTIRKNIKDTMLEKIDKNTLILIRVKLTIKFINIKHFRKRIWIKLSKKEINGSLNGYLTINGFNVTCKKID